MAIDAPQPSSQPDQAEAPAAGPAAATTPAANGPVHRRVLACVTWMAVLIVVMVGKVAEWVPGLGSIPLAKIAFLIVAVSAYLNRDALAAVRVRSLSIARPAIAFMILAIVSVIYSIYKSNTLITSELIVILLLSITLLLKITQTPRDFERILTGHAAAGASLTLGLLLSYHGGRADINDNFDPNDIAYALDTLLPIVLALRHRQSRLGTLLMSALAVMMVVAVVLTGSRGGAIGLIIVTVAVIAFPLSRDRGGALRTFSLGRTLLRCALLLAVFAAAWGYLPTATQQRMATLLDLGSDYNADPTLNASRTVIWRRDVDLALQRPIGYGLGSAERVDGLNGGQYRTAHNSLVEAFVELGAPGLILYLYVYFTCWKHLARVVTGAQVPGASEQRVKAGLYARALRTALAGNLGAGFFLSNAYSPVLWMTVATAAALVRITTAESGTVASVAPPAGAPQTSSVGERT
jgi:O-antigen ligase